MEELKSTEVLDREILEDARKKAHKILKTADETLESQTQQWGKKIQRSVDSIRNVYAERIKKTEEEILARLPLDKRRLRSETAEKFLMDAMDKFLRSLSREKLLSILEGELLERLKACSEEAAPGRGSPPDFIYSGLDLSEARGVLKKALGAMESGGSSVWSGEQKDWNLNEDTHSHEFPFIVINTQTVKITASVETAARAMMNEKRAELAAALLGEGVLND